VVAVTVGRLVRIVEVNRLAVQRESALESEETVGVERDWVRCVISEWGVKESEDVKPVESGQDEQTAGALCIKNVGGG
jgi:hypothetical protein